MTLPDSLRTLPALLSAPACACFNATFAVAFILTKAARASYEAYLPTQQPASSAHARFPRPHGHASWPSGPRTAPRERSQASHCLSRCARSAPPTQSRTACLPLGRSNPRNASGKNPNSIACIVMRAARPTHSSRYLRGTPARAFLALDWRSPPASLGMRCAAIASSASSGNRFVSISMSCPQWIW